MTYLVETYKKEAHTREDGAQGWLLAEDDFRPFAKSQIKELEEGGIVLSDATKEATEAAYKVYLTETVAAYKAAQAARTPEQVAEQNFEIASAFGPGQKIVNVITGEVVRT